MNGLIIVMGVLGALFVIFIGLAMKATNDISKIKGTPTSETKLMNKLK